jgi:DNA (cytosine-5)-methyltransferase 1
MRYISVFSGIEAASVAFQPLGMEPVAFAEVDKHASAVLAAHYPDVPNLGDVTKIDWKKYRGKADLVVGGSPCQSFSIAGKREGLEGESGLMYEFIRCVREVRPRWFIWENVPGALSSEHGAAFGQLLHEMADGGGYGCAWRVLDAQFFGVAQRRRRLFLVGRAGNGYREACQVLFEPDCVPGNSASSRAKRAELAARAGNGAQGAGFGDAAVKAGSIGYEPEQHPTLRAGSNLASTGAVIALQSDGSSSNGAQHGSGWNADGSAYTVNTRDRQSVCIAANQRGEVRLDGTDRQTVGAIPTIARMESAGRRCGMPRTIRPPKEIVSAYDGKALVVYATRIAEMVSREGVRQGGRHV